MKPARLGAICAALLLTVSSLTSAEPQASEFDPAAYAAYGCAWLHIYKALDGEVSDPEGSLRHWKDAQRLLELALSRDPKERLIARPLLACYLRLRMPASAADLLKRFPLGRIARTDDKGLSLLKKVSDVSLVVQVYRVALSDKKLPADRRRMLLREAADYCILRRRYVEAISFYDRATQANPGDAKLAGKVMKLWIAAKRHDNAIQVGRRFAEEQKAFDDEQALAVLERLTLLYGMTRRAAEGAEVFGKLGQRAPDNERLCEWRMVLLRGAGRMEEARQIAEAYLKRHDSVRLRVVLAGLLADAGEGDKAADIIEELIRRTDIAGAKPQFFVGTVVSVAYAVSRDGQPERAVKLLKWLLAFPEGSLHELLRDGIKLDLALAYGRTKEFALAGKIIGEVLAARPDMGEARLVLAQIHWSSGERSVAVSVLRDFVKKRPTGRMAQRIRARLADYLDRLGDLDGAIAVLKENLAEKPDDPRTCNNLGYLYADHNMQLDEALKMIEIAVKAEPQSGAFLDSLGWVKYKIALRDDNVKVLREAEQALMKALKRSPRDPVIQEHAADLLYVFGKWKEAAKGWQTSLDIASDDKELLPNLKVVRNKLRAVRKKLAESGNARPPRLLSRPLRPPPEAP